MRGVANQPSRLVDFVHDAVASIDTSSTIDTFHLGTIPDVDAGRTNRYTEIAVDTIAFFFRFRIVLFSSSSWFPSDKIIGYHDGIFVQHGPLQTSIGTNGNAGLFPEPGKHEVKDPRKDHHKGEDAPVGGRGVGNDDRQFFPAHDISHDQVSDQEGEKRENAEFESFLADLLGIPWGFIESALSRCISFYPIFDPPKNHLHKDRLRTGPATP